MDKNIKRTIAYLLILAAAVLAAYILFLLIDIVVILIISILLAFIFNPLVQTLERSGMKRLPATLAVFASVSFIIYLVLSFIIPKLIFQMNELIESVRYYPIHEQLSKVEGELHRILPFFTSGELTRKVETFIAEQLLNPFELISPVLSSIVSIVTLLVIIPFITFFILKDGNRIMHSLIDYMPNRYFEISYWISKRVTIQLGRYVRAWIFDAAFVGIVMGTGLYLIGVQYSLPLGVIAGLGHLIPYFGPVIGGVPAVIISIVQFGDLSYIPFIALLLLVTYTLDNGFVQPYIFSKSLDIHPILIILLIVAGGQLFGFLGMMFIIPATTVIKTFVKEVYFALKNYRIARI